MKLRLLTAAAVLAPCVAFAQTAPAAPVTVDLTGIATSVVGGVVTILVAVLTALINSRMKDAQARETLKNAVANSLGAIQQAADTTIARVQPTVALPAQAASLAPGVQYVLDHAGDEMKRLGVTPEAVADKIDAQIGLAKIASPAVPTSPVITGKPA